jgi:hypothetical protein
MKPFDTDQIIVVASADEGRFLQWHSPLWKAFDYYNYRQVFEEFPQ